MQMISLSGNPGRAFLLCLVFFHFAGNEKERRNFYEPTANH